MRFQKDIISFFVSGLLVIKYTLDNRVDNLKIKEYSDLLNS